MLTPIVFDFKRKTVAHAGDPKSARAIREVLAAQKKVVLTGPGAVRPKLKS